MDAYCLKQLIHIRREIKELRERKKRMQQRATAMAHIVDNLPRESGIRDDVAKYGSELAYLDMMLDNAIRDCIHLYQQAFLFIQSIDNSEMRQILRLRYLDGMTWQKIAYAIGEHDEQYPRRKHNRFLKSRRL